MSEALRALEMAYTLDTDNAQARVFYAALLIRLGKVALGDELLEPIISTGEAADPRIVSAYLVHKRYDKIAQVWEAYVQVQPKDYEGYLTLAAAYYGMGDRAKSIKALEAAAQVRPDIAAQVALFIDQVRSGTLKID
jgi:cytochrome c-type biogenesis protein CcmH/NrfG